MPTSYITSSGGGGKQAEVPLLLGSGSDRLMSWCPSLNIYRVNRFNLLTNDKVRHVPKRDWVGELDVQERFDIIDELLMHNLIHIVEDIFSYVGFPYTWTCLRVNRLWHDFLTQHLFPRWADHMMAHDASLTEIYQSNDNPGKMCWQVHQLKQVWQNQRPKLKRLSCDSFVLSLKLHRDANLYCGLNNGTLQLWDLGLGSKIKEQEVHDKGVKVLCTIEYVQWETK